MSEGKFDPMIVRSKLVGSAYSEATILLFVSLRRLFKSELKDRDLSLMLELISLKQNLGFALVLCIKWIRGSVTFEFIISKNRETVHFNKFDFCVWILLNNGIYTMILRHYVINNCIIPSPNSCESTLLFRYVTCAYPNEYKERFIVICLQVFF